MSPGSDDVSDALEELLARFRGLLWRASRRRGLPEGAWDELCQDVRIRLWRALGSGELIATARASYVYRTALSAAMDMIRRRQARREEQWVEWDPDRPATGKVGSAHPIQALEEDELAAQVDRVIATLTEPRDVVVRMHLAGYERREIARLLGWTDGKTRNLLHRGLADLRARLKEVGIGPEVIP
jgi:RNA polymerase sigma factor (sigma-70 family)